MVVTSLSSGYIRDADQRPNDQAVRWWYVEEIDGTTFSRGGRVATARLARAELDRARTEARMEAQRIAELRKPHLWLYPNGEYRQVPR